MTIRTAFIDDKLAAQEFHTGDTVRKPGLSGIWISPYAGKVLWSNVNTGKVEVQWPWGAESESATELILSPNDHVAAPNYDQSYSSWEGVRNIDSPEVLKSDEKWRKSLASVLSTHLSQLKTVRYAACKYASNDAPEALTSYLLSIKFSSLDPEIINHEVNSVYSHGRRLAIYWKDTGRRFRVTQREQNSGILECPRCDGILKPRVYRQGRRVLLCRICGFIVRPKDLLHRQEECAVQEE